MATFNFFDIREKYDSFKHPSFLLKIDDEDINEICKKSPIAVFDVSVDLTSGYEASTCEFSIGDVYNKNSGDFDFEKVKKVIKMGSKIEIYTGYNGYAYRIFLGLTTGVNYLYEENDIPCIRVSAMDAKGIMMSSSYSKQIQAKSYSEAVDSIIKNLMDKLTGASVEIITSKDIKDTPDAKEAGQSGDEGPTDRTIEMVAESDYEFIVRAAKRYNYDFFISNGEVVFRPAKSDDSVLHSIGSDWPVQSFDIRYDITGMVQTIEARGMDINKGDMISKSVKYTNDLCHGSIAKKLIKGTSRVYIDPSIRSVEDAELRANSLFETMSYRFGHLDMKVAGIPEFMPGYFYEIDGFGQGADNKFYVNRVTHSIDRDGRYNANIQGIANSAKTGSGFGSADGLF